MKKIRSEPNIHKSSHYLRYKPQDIIAVDDDIYGFKRNTIQGVMTIMAGMLIQFCLGFVSIWGNIVIYVASKLRGGSPGLSIKFALVVFPMTLAMGSVGMQIAAQISRKIHPKK